MMRRISLLLLALLTVPASASLINIAGPRLVQVVGGGGSLTAIETTADNLVAGTSTLLSDTGLPTHADQFNWQQQGPWFDDVRKKAFVIGRYQGTLSAGTDDHTWMGTYDAAAGNAWSGGYVTLPDTFRGHVWANFAFDPATGNAYTLESGGQVDHIAVHNIEDANGTWSFVGQDPETKGAPTNQLYSHGGEFDFVSSGNSMVWHPTLFGATGGLIIGTQKGYLWYNPAADTYGAIVTQATWTGIVGSSQTQDKSGAVYCSAAGYALISIGEGSLAQFKVVSSASVTRTSTDTPVRMGYDTASTGDGPEMKVVDLGASGCFGLEAGSNQDGGAADHAHRVWKWNAGTEVWDDTGHTHPVTVTQDDFVVGRVRGAVWILEETGSGWRSRLFKPDTSFVLLVIPFAWRRRRAANESYMRLAA